MASRTIRDEEILWMMESIGYGDLLFEGTCLDCGKEVSVRLKITDYDTGAYIVTGGALWFSRDPIKDGDDLYIYTKMKCDECFSKDPAIKDQECEVYSRVVGYLRPISQWNPGKRAEYNDRKMFKSGEEDARKD